MASIAGQAAMASLLSGGGGSGNGGGAAPPSLTSTSSSTANSNSSLSGGNINVGSFAPGSNNWIALTVIGSFIIIGLIVLKVGKK